MRRLLVLLLLFVIGIALPLGCTERGSQTNGANNSLNVYNWSTYIDPEVISQFEQQFGVKVNYDTYESNEDLYAKLKPGNPGYDVIFPSDYIVTIMGKENLLEELNLNNIPNVQHLDAKFLNPPFDPRNQYSLPYQWGTMGLGYNSQIINEQIDSWEAVFDPNYRDRVSLLEDVRAMLGLVLIYLGEDPNTTDPNLIAQARDYLIKHSETITAFAPDTGQLLLDRGEVDIAVEWSGDLFQVMEENPNLRYAIPKEGSIVWVDNLAIAKDAPHKELAEKFINFILEPEVSAKVSNFIRYGTPNKAAIEQGLINQEDLNNPAIYPPPEVYKQLTFLRDVGEETRLYDEAWTEIKISLGQ